MKLVVCSVLDKAVGAYLPPFYSRSQAEAVRSFQDAVVGEQPKFRAHAEDYLLMYLGLFDDASGLFECVEPKRVVSALECLPKE